MNTPHPRAQLSAYLDGALGPSERAAVDAHLDTCADCRARLAELRATSRLIAALPSLVPTRRLVPHVAAQPMWLAPLRTLTTLASGVSVFLFLATALLANIGTLASQSATSAYGGAAAAPAASVAPVGPAAPNASPKVAEGQRNSVGTSATAAPVPAPVASAQVDSAKALASANASAAAFSVTSTAPQDAAARTEQHALEPERAAPNFGNPWLWLGLAIVTGAMALYLQRRLSAA